MLSAFRHAAIAAAAGMPAIPLLKICQSDGFFFRLSVFARLSLMHHFPFRKLSAADSLIVFRIIFYHALCLRAAARAIEGAQRVMRTSVIPRCFMPFLFDCRQTALFQLPRNPTSL